jgi:protein gp37
MGQNTSISWTHHTFNPWWGCVEVGGSPACGGPEPHEGECYAKTWDRRCGGNHWGSDAPRSFLSNKHWAAPLKWNRDAEEAGEHRRVFIMSMGDWAEGRPDERPHLERLWRLFDKTPWLDKLMLTKRPQLIRSIYPFVRRQDVWMGITAENQRWLDIRWPFLRDVEAEIHWLSIEPMFESMTLPVDFLNLGKRAWVIVGGQSGRNANDLRVNWVRHMRDQCREAGVPFHFKQGSQTANWGGSREFKLFDRFPADLQIREFPNLRK